MPQNEYKGSVNLTDIYQALSDQTRLRILHLLAQSPLCVQHLQGALEAPQVMISKHLLILKESGLVECQKVRNWRLYRLPPKPPAAIRKNLDCLLSCLREEQLFGQDLQRLASLSPELPQLLLKKTKPAHAARPSNSGSSPAPLPAQPDLSSSPGLEDHLL